MLLRLTPTAPPSRVPARAIFIRENHGKSFTLWLFNIAMENAPFLDDFPIKTSIFKWFSMAMLNNQRVYNIIGLNGES